MPSTTEENYLKAIFKLSNDQGDAVSTNSIAAELQTSAASVSDMLKRLSDKKLIAYEKYKGVKLRKEGKEIAIGLIRSHRLWEVFLVDKLNFSWDQVHDIAEELEHVRTPHLISSLEEFLGYPTHDPHGDPIPDADGNIQNHGSVSLNELQAGEKGVVVGVNEQSPEFLQYLDKIPLSIGARIEVLELNDYDNSRSVKLDGDKQLFFSEKVCENLLIKKL